MSASDDKSADEVTAEAVETDAGWQVELTVDGERRLVDQVHLDRETAELAAKELDAATSRWEGARQEEPPASAPHEPEP